MEQKMQRSSSVRSHLYVLPAPMIMALILVVLGLQISKEFTNFFAIILVCFTSLQTGILLLLNRERKRTMRVKKQMLARFANLFLNHDFTKFAIMQSNLKEREKNQMITKHRELEQKMLKLHEDIARESLTFRSALKQDVVYLIADFHNQIRHVESGLKNLEIKLEQEVNWRNKELENQVKYKKETEEIMKRFVVAK